MKNTAALPVEPYAAAIAPDGGVLYVSLWGGARIQLFDTTSMRLIGEWASGEHPNALVLSKDGRRLFVACGSSASVWVYDTLTGEPIEQISTSLYPEAPPTSTPNSLAVSPDGQKLLVATADNNAVALIDISNSANSVVAGFIPSGAYPTGAIFSRDGNQLFILSGKGVTPPLANPGGRGLERRLLGTVTVVATPDRTTLAEYTRKVLTLTPYSDATRLTPVGAPIASPIPGSVGAASPITHVFYVIRENRTSDQVLGDMTWGNGDPSLAIFGTPITPNAHALAQNFVLFDNFYVDADVSYNGHAFSTAAYATDFVEKMWQTQTAGRGGPYLGEGIGLMGNAFGNIAAPAAGYLWDYARRANLSVRSDGEFVSHASRAPNGDVVAVESVPGLAGAVAPSDADWAKADRVPLLREGAARR